MCRYTLALLRQATAWPLLCEAGSTLMRCHFKTLFCDTFSSIIHTKTPENADVNEDFRVDRWKRWRKKRHMPSVPVQIEASIQDGGWLTHAQSQVAAIFIAFKRFSVDRWKRNKNVSLDDNIFLRFCLDENGFFWKHISVVGAWYVCLFSIYYGTVEEITRPFKFALRGMRHLLPWQFMPDKIRFVSDLKCSFPVFQVFIDKEVN